MVNEGKPMGATLNQVSRSTQNERELWATFELTMTFLIAEASIKDLCATIRSSVYVHKLR
jgi:hypothetical protein